MIFHKGQGGGGISKFNGTSTPKGSYSAKTGVNCTMMHKGQEDTFNYRPQEAIFKVKNIREE